MVMNGEKIKVRRYTYICRLAMHGKQTFIIVGDVTTMGHFLLKTLENVSDSIASRSQRIAAQTWRHPRRLDDAVLAEQTDE